MSWLSAGSTRLRLSLLRAVAGDNLCEFLVDRVSLIDQNANALRIHIVLLSDDRY
jgi:hypothetical protein